MGSISALLFKDFVFFIYFMLFIYSFLGLGKGGGTLDVSAEYYDRFLLFYLKILFIYSFIYLFLRLGKGDTLGVSAE